MINEVNNILEELRNEMGLAGFGYYYGMIGVFLQVFFILPMIRKVDRAWKDKEHMQDRFNDVL